MKDNLPPTMDGTWVRDRPLRVRATFVSRKSMEKDGLG
jgi:hypothetical protein